MVATELLKLAMETDEERKERLKKMVATTQLKLAPETEDERRARLEYLSDNPIYIPNNSGFHTGFLAWGGESIGALMKCGNVRGGGWGLGAPPPPR